MKLLIMCEGPNELKIIDILLDNNMLIFSRNDLLGLEAYHARQISSSSAIKTALNIYPGNDVRIIRIGDTQNDTIKIPLEYKNKFSPDPIKKYCTKPEIEMLLIISEGLLQEFTKVKSSVDAKTFAKQNILFNRRKYKNDTAFYENYYGQNPELLKLAIEEYKRKKHSHKKDELYLADLLKK